MKESDGLTAKGGHVYFVTKTPEELKNETFRADRLAAYEDTGLSPEEVEKMKAENAELRARLEKAVEDVAERIKAAFYYEFDEIIPSIMSDKIDEIVREASHDD